MILQHNDARNKAQDPKKHRFSERQLERGHLWRALAGINLAERIGVDAARRHYLDVWAQGQDAVNDSQAVIARIGGGR